MFGILTAYGGKANLIIGMMTAGTQTWLVVIVSLEPGWRFLWGFLRMSPSYPTQMQVKYYCYIEKAHLRAVSTCASALRPVRSRSDSLTRLIAELCERERERVRERERKRERASGYP